jgi:hypothetical protein
MKYILLAVCLVALLAGTSVLADSKLQAMYASIFNSDGTFTEQVRNDLCSFPEHDFSSYSGDNWVGTDSTDPGHYDYEFTFCAVSEEGKCKARNGSLCQYDVTKDREFTDSLASFSASPAPTVTYVGMFIFHCYSALSSPSHSSISLSHHPFSSYLPFFPNFSHLAHPQTKNQKVVYN